MSFGFKDWTKASRLDRSQWESALSETLCSCETRTGSAVISRRIPLSEATIRQGPLQGVPYGLKEAFDLRDYPTTGSSLTPCLSRSPIRKNSAVVERLAELGAVCVAKTQMNELAYGLSGENPHFGDCPHPTIPSALSGGSSSGSAYLVGSGTLPLAVGTDTGGSIRVPAAWCGIFGVRWTPGYMTEGMMPLAESFDTVGWFTKDAGSMQETIQAWFGEAATSSGTKLRLAALPADDYLEKESRHRLGQILERLPLTPWADSATLDAMLPDARLAFNILQSTEAYRHHEELIAAHGALIDPAVVSRILRARDWTAKQLEWAASIRDQICAMFAAFFDAFDCLVMPICPGPARPMTRAKAKLREDTLNLTTPASLAGLPALAVPVFLDEMRSVGLQFIFKKPEPDVPSQLLNLWSSI